MLLLQNGANIDAVDNGRCSALLRSIWGQNEPVATTLIACGAALQFYFVPNRDYCTWLQWSRSLRALCALADKSIPVEFLNICTTEVEHARKRVCKARIGLIRWRASEICIALHSLELSALEMVAIIDEACAPFANCVPFHAKWQIVVAVKHFHN